MSAELGIVHLAAAAAELSVVVPVLREQPGIAALHARLRQGLAPLGRRCEVIYVVDGPWRDTLEALKALRRQNGGIEILTFARPMGEAAALTVGLRHAAGAIVLTVPAELEVDPAELARLVRALEAGGADIVTLARRPPGRVGRGKLERLLGSPAEQARGRS